MPAEQFIGIRNLRFLLYELLELEALTAHDFFADHSRETFDAVLASAQKIAENELLPVHREMDENPPRLVAGRIHVHPSVRRFIQQCGRDGWIAAHESYSRGGQQLPNLLMSAVRGIFAAANYSASVYPALTAGAAHLITTFGSSELAERFIPKMLGGQWQGTMALTEPQAGSSLADVRTAAQATTEGYYQIRGEKIFISAADHDCVENVVNLVLARIEGAPAGTRGISLFVVPRLRDQQGELVDNDLATAGMFHKMGYRGAPITHLRFGENGDCRGWLVGEANRGLTYMFQMMNEARIEVGMGAAAIASAAYYASLEYTRQRPQGRRVTDRDPTQPQIPIIAHADVKRMLLFQRAVVEGSLALVLQCAKWVDQLHVLEAGDERERVDLLLNLLTPVAKSYPSEMAIQAISQGLQCLGGYGYCTDFPLEQHYRDARIHPIHEGTTGIQALDLLGRKVVMKNGRALLLYLDAVSATIGEAQQIAALTFEAEALAAALARLKNVTQHLTGLALQGKIALFLADATLYLELFGIVTVAWLWLRQGITAARAGQRPLPQPEENFYRGKLHTCRFFFAYELPKTEGLTTRLLNSDGLTLAMDDALFS